MTPISSGLEADVDHATPSTRSRGLPAIRIGLAGGAAAIMCCLGPTVLAIFGLVSAATAFTWATNLYDNYTWWFRIAGLALMVLLVFFALRRRDSCSMSGIRSNRNKLVLTLGVALATYVALYALTTWLGNVGT